MFQYDPVGRLYQTVKADGKKIRTEYSADGTTKKEKWIDGSTTAKELTYTYDAIGTLIGATDGLSTITWKYDGGKLKSESQTLPSGILAQYVNTYQDGRISTVAFKIGTQEDSKLAYKWTNSGQVKSIRQTGATVSTKSVAYEYDKIGRTTSVKRYTNTTASNPVASTEYSYSETGGTKSSRLRSIKHLGKTSSSSSIDEVLASYAYEWDASGRLTKEVSSKDGQTSYTYDAVSQLTAADYANMPDTSLGYDANGNRNSNGNEPGPMNRQASDGESSFEYDSNGNMISRTKISTGAVIRYTFDVRDRMTDVTFYPSETGQPTKKIHYEYDPLNRRISESTDTNGDGTFEKVEYFVNHGLRSSDGDAGDSVALRLNGSGEVTSRYFHGADVDEILAEENISPTGTRDVLWVLTDIRGSARDLARKTDGITSIVNHIKYDAFGQKISESDAAITHLYGYTGREYNEVTKLQYNRARYYDPKLGRWINDDPKGFDAGDANLYRYVGNAPTNGTDPSGEKIVLPKSEVDSFKEELSKDAGQNVVDALLEADIGNGQIELSVSIDGNLHHEFPFKFKQFNANHIKFDQDDPNDRLELSREIVVSMLEANRTIRHESLDNLRLEVAIREAIIGYAIVQKVDFAGFQTWKQKYWYRGDDNYHYVNPGLSPGDALHETLKDPKTFFGCQTTIKMTVIAGIALGNRREKGKTEYMLANGATFPPDKYSQPHELGIDPDWTIDIHAREGGMPIYGKGQHYQTPADIKQGDYIPGDWIYYVNRGHRDGTGDEGHNAIYVGWRYEALYGKVLSLDRIKAEHNTYWAVNVGVPSPKIFENRNSDR